MLTRFRDDNDDIDSNLVIVKAGEPIPLEEIAEALSSDIKPKRSPNMQRLARNLPNQEKMYKINNIGDLPMFRFG